MSFKMQVDMIVMEIIITLANYRPNRFVGHDVFINLMLTVSTAMMTSILYSQKNNNNTK